MVGRIPLLDVHPVLADGSPKATVGEPFPVRATVFREGHDRFGAEVVPIAPDGTRGAPVRMREIAPGTDRYEGWFTPDVTGAWSFEVQAWSDPLATWLHDAPIKIDAGVDVDLMHTEGRLLLERVTAAGFVPDLADTLLDSLALAAQSHPLRELLTVAGPFPAYADRRRALTGSWYEFFPRSEGGLVGATERLDAIAAMGFDVVYLPPIHPIGEVNRKGPNNQVLPEGSPIPATWVGSPWAIGSRHGGHDAVEPALGTLSDFDAFVARAGDLGLEVALDLALQAAPDHPWVGTNPEWFTTRADGTIAYAENPPKKYQDIYPVNFDNDPAGIRAEVLRIVRFWMDRGVRIFRVDNPHTKPVDFWAWLLAEIRATDPDVLFLAEAFTRPAMMHALGEVGFHQSYTYFTWRNARGELEDYLTELASESDHLMRPNLFPVTPDILHAYLQDGGPAAFRIRATLAALASPTWGVYSGFELCENRPVRPGSEEYLDSEKYQIVERDWAAAEAAGTTLAPYLTRLNELRRLHPALGLLRNLRIVPVDGEGLIAFTKQTPGPDGETLIAVIALDPHAAVESVVHLDLAALGLPARFEVHDELSGAEWVWGADNYVRLDPATGQVAHLLRVIA
ncbi:maltotransferase domain-containing protein [Nocardioides sp.]|uniref:maltotransferase domain-containing protein n=1 Tax=Nocardioides sp. TaxID=35761 RepID=UPI002613D840|nr:maltotransferase domain-containing protein [Nocardioides sp.]